MEERKMENSRPISIRGRHLEIESEALEAIYIHNYCNFH